MDVRVFSTELGIRLSFIKTSEFPGGGGLNPPTPFGTPLHIGDVEVGLRVV
jgi:hypothetical protein